jgi:hypothetical protein
MLEFYGDITDSEIRTKNGSRVSAKVRKFVVVAYENGKGHSTCL